MYVAEFITEIIHRLLIRALKYIPVSSWNGINISPSSKRMWCGVGEDFFRESVFFKLNFFNCLVSTSE